MAYEFTVSDVLPASPPDGSAGRPVRLRAGLARQLLRSDAGVLLARLSPRHAAVCLARACHPGHSPRARRAATCARDAAALLGRVGVAAMLWPWRVAHVIEYF